VCGCVCVYALGSAGRVSAAARCSQETGQKGQRLRRAVAYGQESSPVRACGGRGQGGDGRWTGKGAGGGGGSHWVGRLDGLSQACARNGVGVVMRLGDLVVGPCARWGGARRNSKAGTAIEALTGTRYTL